MLKNSFENSEKIIKQTYKIAKGIYFPVIKCYSCKKNIPYNAHTCPMCRTNFDNSVYKKLTKWQKTGSIISYGIAGLFFITFATEGSIIGGLIIGLIIIGLSKFVIQKIQSIRNYIY